MDSLSIELSKLKGFFIKESEKNGKIYVAFLAEENGVNIKDKRAFQNFSVHAKPSEYSTHFIKTSLNKDLYMSLTEEQKQAIKIVGNINIKTSSTNQNITENEREEKDEKDLPF